MSTKLGLQLVAGAIAATSLSGAALAQTNAGSTGTIFLNIVDTTQNTSFMFDTGIPVSSFNGSTASVSDNLASNANYIAFEGTIQSGDSVDYSVVGANGSGGPLSYVTAEGSPTTNGTKGNDVATQIGTFLGQIKNPSGGSTFNSSSALASNDWARGGYEATLITDIGGVSDNAAINTPLAFYSILVSNPSATHGGASVTTQAFDWNLSAAGLLTYNASSTTVPLPAPLLLLVSGFGVMGLFSRRGVKARRESV